MRWTIGLLGALLIAFGVGEAKAEIIKRQIPVKDEVVEKILSVKNPVYYVKLTANARVHSRPVLLKNTTVQVLRKGDVLPVLRLVKTPYGIFYEVGKGLYVHHSVAKVIPWL